MGHGKRQINVAYEICLGITPTLNRRILKRAGVLLLEQHARHFFPDDRWRGRWLLGLLRRQLLSHCCAAEEDRRDRGRCSDPHHDTQFGTLWRQERIAPGY
jgi:hypothetical protein